MAANENYRCPPFQLNNMTVMRCICGTRATKIGGTIMCHVCQRYYTQLGKLRAGYLGTIEYYPDEENRTVLHYPNCLNIAHRFDMEEALPLTYDINPFPALPDLYTGSMHYCRECRVWWYEEYPELVGGPVPNPLVCKLHTCRSQNVGIEVHRVSYEHPVLGWTFRCRSCGNAWYHDREYDASFERRED